MDTYYYLFALLALSFLLVKYLNRKEDDENDNDECDI